MTPDPSPAGAQPAFLALKIFAYVILALLVAAIVYAAWLSISNWQEIRV